MNNCIRKVSLCLYAAILVANIALPNLNINASDRVPAENIEQFVDVFTRIKEQYVDDVEDETLFKAAIKGMVTGLDPHSSFLTSDDFNELKIGTTGKFGGLGIEITTEDGFVKVIFDKKYGEWLGCHMIGYNVTEMIAEVVAARKLETTAHEIIKSIHPHPTMSEAIMEATAAAYDEVIHL